MKQNIYKIIILFCISPTLCNAQYIQHIPEDDQYVYDEYDQMMDNLTITIEQPKPLSKFQILLRKVGTSFLLSIYSCKKYVVEKFQQIKKFFSLKAYYATRKT